MLHLRYFVAVAEELNFSAAARRLHMAASPLSQRIKDLEHELDVRLFDRSTHHVTLTAAGSALLPMARDVLEQVNSIPWRVKEAVAGRRRTVYMGMPAGVHPALRERVRALGEAVAGSIELKRWPGTSAELVAGVRDGRLPLALVRLPVSDPALEVLPVMTERMGASVPAARFAGRTSLRVADLVGLTYVTASDETRPAVFAEIDQRLASAGIRDRVQLSTPGYGGVAELVGNGAAFSISVLDPESPLRHYAVGDQVVLPIEDFPAELGTAFAWPVQRGASGDLAEIVGHVRRIFAEPLVR